MNNTFRGVVTFSVLLLLAGLLFPVSMFANELASNPDIETVVDYAHFEDNVISPNRDGKFEEAILKIGLKKRLSVNVRVWDAMNPGSGYYNDGEIGFIIKTGYQGPGEYDFRTNGTYNMWEIPNPNVKFLMHDSVYSFRVVANSHHDDGNFQYEGYVESGPFFVKTASSEIRFNPVSGSMLTGKVLDNFINFKSTVENVYGEDYNVNDYLITNYELKDATNKTVKSGSLTLEQDGTFAIPLSGLAAGNYSATIRAQDIVENPEQVETLKFEWKNSDPVDRIKGDNRFETSVEISKAGWKTADTVILSRGDNFADALAGVPLAHKLNAPILMTSSSKLNEKVLKEIQRLGAKDVVILGGTGAISQKVENDLKSAKLKVRRISGGNRFETAALIAGEVAPNGASNIVVANGMDFPDALSVASHSASKGIPILLTSANKLSESTSNAIKKLGVKSTIVVGGTSVVSEKVKGQLPNPTRLSGKDRYETNVAINKHFNVDSNSMYVATGQNYADALTGAVLAAKHKTSILLVHQRVPDVVVNYITNKKLTNLSIFGGSGAVSEKVANDLENLVK